ncbi:MAG: hypothetical protein SFW07_00055 [Gammaproteobacteria bacterium]|nr:hypothetical protein [Gammaproteobacteria bacterium]
MLDVKTVLVTLRPYLDNQFSGFNDMLSELEGPEKEQFISDCQDIIQNGWDKKFKRNPNLEFLHELISDPGKALNLDSTFNKATRYIVRLCLFRFMVDACKENAQLIRDPKWFRETHAKLTEELNTFNNAERVVLTYNGQRIESLYDVRRLRENNRQELQDMRVSPYAILLKLIVLISLGSSLFRNRLSVQNQLIVSISISTTMALLFLLYRCIPSTRMAQTHFFANRAEQQLQNQLPGPQTVLKDPNVQKFISVTEADLQLLEHQTPQPGRK